MTELAGKTCTPCRGGVPPLEAADAERYLEDVPDWQLKDDAKRIERTFWFKDFKQALAFVDRVGALAEDEGHHPDVTFGWGYATISLHTHKIKGLHENDFIMAAKFDRVGARAAGLNGAARAGLTRALRLRRKPAHGALADHRDRRRRGLGHGAGPGRGARRARRGALGARPGGGPHDRRAPGQSAPSGGRRRSSPRSARAAIWSRPWRPTSCC